MKRTFNHIAASYRSKTEGNVAIMFGISAFFLVGGLALAVDLSNAYFAKQRLQNTTDAVALLAAKDKSLNTKAKLEETAQALYDATYPGSAGDRVIINDIRRDGDQVTVTAGNNIDTFFSGVFNRSNLDVGVTSTAVFAQRSIDIALVLDSTGSMSEPVSGRGGPTKLSSLQAAGNNLIDKLSSSDNDKLRLSVVPFSQYVNVGTNNSRAGWLNFPNNDQNAWTGCVGSRVGGRDESPREAGGPIPASARINCASEILPLTNNLNSVRASIDGFQARGLTYIPSGIVWGWRTLVGELPQRVAPAPRDAENRKVMIIMTDGKNTVSKNGVAHNGRDLNGANVTTSRLCEAVKNDEIEVYTITFSLNDAATKSLLQSCASDPDKFFDAQTASELTNAFQDIARSIEVLRISA